MPGELTPWLFEDEHLVRTINVDGDPWWIAADVCRALDLSNTAMTLRKLDDDEKGIRTFDTLGGPQELSVISEPGLYKLVGRSSKPVAKRFDRWVRHEVLPSIRKTGSYTVEPRETNGGDCAATPSSVPEHQIRELRAQPFRTRAAFCESIRLGCGLAAYRDMLVIADLPAPPAGVADISDVFAADPVAPFILACVREVPGGRVPARAMYRAFEAWSHASGRRPVTETMFGRLMRDRLRKDSAGATRAYLDCELHDVPLGGALQ